LADKKSQPSMRELAKLINIWDEVESHPERVSREMERAVNKYPGFAAGWGHLGLAYMQSGRADDAEKALLEAVRLEPQSPGWYLALSTLYKLAVANARGLTGRLETVKKMAEAGVGTPEGYPAMPPDYVTLITIDALGCDYDHARRMAERYAKDVLNLTKEKEFTRSAVDNLLDIQMADGA
jgi:tetratricopeptide (TPR) repeat protein